MRVAILLNARFPTEKAYGIQVMAMARGFAEAGAEIAIVYPRRSLDVPKQENNIAFIPFGWKIGVRMPWIFHFARVLGALQAVSVLHAWKPDIVLVNDPVQAAWLASKFSVVWDVHDLPNIHGVMHRLLISTILKRVKGVVSTNTLKIEELEKIIGKKLPQVSYKILHNPVSVEPSAYQAIDRDSARKRFSIPSTQKTIVYAGQLFDWKGVDTVVEAMSYIKNPAIVFHIIGGLGQDLNRIQTLASTIPSGRVIVHGQRPFEEIPYWLRAADIVVIPNSGKFDVSVRDTDPMKLYEALAAQAAILVSNLPSLRHLDGVIEERCFVPSDDSRAWAQAIEDSIVDQDLISTLRNKASTFPHLTSKNRAEQLLTFFRGIL